MSTGRVFLQLFLVQFYSSWQLFCFHNFITVFATTRYKLRDSTATSLFPELGNWRRTMAIGSSEHRSEHLADLTPAFSSTFQPTQTASPSRVRGSSQRCGSCSCHAAFCIVAV